MSAYLDTSAAAVQAAPALLVIGTQAGWFWSAIPQRVSTYTVSTGTRLTLKFSNSHNLYLMESQAKYDACDFRGSTRLASDQHGGASDEQDIASGLSNLYEATVATEGTLRFACQFGDHCAFGQRVWSCTSHQRCHHLHPHRQLCRHRHRHRRRPRRRRSC